MCHIGPSPGRAAACLGQTEAGNPAGSPHTMEAGFRFSVFTPRPITEHDRRLSRVNILCTRDSGKSHYVPRCSRLFTGSPFTQAKRECPLTDRQTDGPPHSYLVQKGGAVHGRLFGDWWAAAKGLGDHPIVVGHPQSTLVHVHLLFQQSACSRQARAAEAGPG